MKRFFNIVLLIALCASHSSQAVCETDSEGQGSEQC